MALKLAIPIIIAVLAALVLTGALLIASLRKLNSNERKASATTGFANS